MEKTDGRTSVVQKNNKQRRLLQLAGVAAVAGLLLVTGALIGNAMGEDSSTISDTPVVDDNKVGPSNQLSNGGSDGDSGSTAESSQGIPPARPVTLTNESDDGGRGFGPDELAKSQVPQYFGHCAGDLGDVLSGGVIDPNAAGFVPQLLSPGFVLSSVNLRADADCDDPLQQVVSLDTMWQTADEMFQVWVSQRQSNEPGANIVRDAWAEFWHDGYYFSVSVNQSYNIKALEIAEDGADDAPTSGIAAEPGFAPANTAEVSALLETVVGELTGDSTLRCFYRQVDGGWDALADLGIGDPRSAVPSGFIESYVYAEVYEAPATDCDIASNVQLPTSFNANWYNDDQGWLSFNVYTVNEYYSEELKIGRSSEYHVSWSDGTFQYEVYGNDNNGGLGTDVLGAIARAVDPNFETACRLIEREFTQAELASVGIGWPTTPDGYTMTEVYSTGTETTSGCGSDIDEGYFNASWSFESDGGGMIYANAWKNEQNGDRYNEDGYISQNHMSWQSESGVFYNIESWDKTDEDGNREAMIQVAESLDPGIDIDSFSDEPDVPRPIAVPVQEPASGGGSSSDGVATDDR